jgi:hypothetical protein
MRGETLERQRDHNWDVGIFSFCVQTKEFDLTSSHWQIFVGAGGLKGMLSAWRPSHDPN